MEDNNNNKQQQLQIELDAQTAEGVYSNMALVAHSMSEFIVDFVRILPNMPKAKVKSRVVMTPEHAKGLMMALQAQVASYEQQFGPIKTPGKSENSDTLPISFGSGEA